MTDSTQPTASDLLRAAVTEPGLISAAFTAFHEYSFGNQWLAYVQCKTRGIPLGPIAPFKKWHTFNRHVRKGEKAIELCMPVQGKRESIDAAGNVDEHVFTKFIFRRNWFVLAQTDGEPFVLPALPAWEKDRALAVLNITEGPFDLLNGNILGYARGRSVTVNPVAPMPFRVLMHEIAHVALGHTEKTEQSDFPDQLPRDLREVEAESVAMIVSAALNQPGVEYSRGYIQHWYKGNEIPDLHARRILKCADQILKAGREPIASGE